MWPAIEEWILVFICWKLRGTSGRKERKQTLQGFKKIRSWTWQTFGWFCHIFAALKWFGLCNSQNKCPLITSNLLTDGQTAFINGAYKILQYQPKLISSIIWTEISNWWNIHQCRYIDRNSFSNITLGICSALVYSKHLLNKKYVFFLFSYLLPLKQHIFVQKF